MNVRPVSPKARARCTFCRSDDRVGAAIAGGDAALRTTPVPMRVRRVKSGSDGDGDIAHLTPVEHGGRRESYPIARLTAPPWLQLLRDEEEAQVYGREPGGVRVLRAAKRRPGRPARLTPRARVASAGRPRGRLYIWTRGSMIGRSPAARRDLARAASPERACRRPPTARPRPRPSVTT